MQSIDLQIFGGRGSASSASKSTSGKSASKKAAGGAGIPVQRKYSNKELNSMSKSSLKKAAKDAYIGYWMREWNHTREKATAAYNTLVAPKNLSIAELKKMIRKHQK